MNRALRSIKELISPGSVRHSSLPPMEAGLRPNSDLDAARVAVQGRELEPDDILVLADGTVWFTCGTDVLRVTDAGHDAVASLPGAAGALDRLGDGVVVAVEGYGLVRLGRDGSSTPLCLDASVQRCVTDVAVLADGSILVAVGSARYAPGQWAEALVAGDRSGSLVVVRDGSARTVAADLAWPGGVSDCDDEDVLVSFQFTHRIERRAKAAFDQHGQEMRSNLPVYPGRIRWTDSGWWVAAPLARNRMSELILDEPKLLAEMVETIPQEEWPMPRLRGTTPYTDVLQMGQLRMLGVLKPWAPPRSYGLVMLLDRHGRPLKSHHSRVDGDRHGVTGVDQGAGVLWVAGKGCRSVLSVMEEE